MTISLDEAMQRKFAPKTVPKPALIDRATLTGTELELYEKHHPELLQSVVEQTAVIEVLKSAEIPEALCKLILAEMEKQKKKKDDEEGQ